MTLIPTVAAQLKLHPTDLTFSTPRNARILRHYQREVDAGHLDHLTATERAIGDLYGRNYHAKLDQHSTLRS